MPNSNKIDAAEAAAILGVTPGYVRYFLMHGDLHSHGKFGGSTILDRKEVLELKAKRQAKSLTVNKRAKPWGKT